LKLSLSRYPAVSCVYVFAVLATALNEIPVALAMASVRVRDAVLLSIGKPCLLPSAIIMSATAKFSRLLKGLGRELLDFVRSGLVGAIKFAARREQN
jgi:hypothetical protein